MNKFEKLIEYIINDEDDKARALFHDIVVEKSRDIYESIMDEESMEEVAGNQVEDMVDEISTEESMGEGDEAPMDGDMDDMDDMDDMSGSMPADGEVDADDLSSEHQEIEGTVMNIDSKLDELLAKFDEIMGGGEIATAGEEPAGEEEPHPEEESMGMMEAGNPFAKSGSGKSGSGKSGSGVSGSGKSGSGKSGSGKMESKSTAQLMREYVDKIGDIYGGQGDAAEGTAVGTGNKTGKTTINKKPGSVGPGANFGGESNNIANGGANESPDNKPVPQPSNEYTKGEGNLPHAGKFQNVPGGDAGKTGFKSNQAHQGGGAETKEKETGKLAGDDGSIPVNDKSVQKQNTGKK